MEWWESRERWWAIFDEAVGALVDSDCVLRTMDLARKLVEVKLDAACGVLPTRSLVFYMEKVC